MSLNSIKQAELIQELAHLELEVNQKRIQSSDYYKLNKQQHAIMQRIAQAHIDSFDFMIETGLVLGFKNIMPLELELPNKDKLELSIVDFTIGTPVLKNCASKNQLIYPSECRMRGISYKAPLTLSFAFKINGVTKDIFQDVVGEIPIMIKSKRCNLANLTPKELVKKREDSEEFGGYFIINGNERLIRFLTAQRRNYPMAISRKSWKESGQLFTEYGVSIRCVKPNQTSCNMILHYLNNGSARLRFFYQKQPVFVPIIMILKALYDYTDQFIFQELMKGCEHDSYYKSCIANMLRLVQQESLFCQQHVKQYIGQRFRVKCDLPSWYSDEDITDFLLKESVAVHLEKNEDKFNLLVFMTKKLFSFARGECASENPDNPMFHELFLSGHIYFTLLLERCEMFLSQVKATLKKMINSSQNGQLFKPTPALIKKCCAANYSTISRPIDYLLATGNLQSRSGLGLMQVNGLSVMAEKINFWRFISHFRAVHRGSFFGELRTTTCRKLYPEAWGFLCPVHTPDGAPCGLLNHLSTFCYITNFQPPVKNLINTLISFGLETHEGPPLLNYKNHYSVLLDGACIGFIHEKLIQKVILQLRYFKSKCSNQIPPTTELGFVPKRDKATQFPGLFIFTTPARFMRPVYNLSSQSIELIGTFEQAYLDICVTGKESYSGITTHQDINETSMLSILASLIPFPDFNQSPRNMYACQMGKQTMGTPSHTLKYRCDNKMYSILYSHTPLVRPVYHDYFHMDDYPIGTNAVVAVISYTGYDMEDALILNKSSVERGFKHGCIYKTSRIDLNKLSGGKAGEINFMFGRSEKDEHLASKLDIDGLPYIGTKIEYGDPICSYIDLSTGLTQVEKYKSMELAYIWDVKIFGSDSGKEILQNIAITFFIPRKPIIGDKFANRHGQKGVCSFLWPVEDMPFTQNGITPDVIFNPHGYPSRMTIGMMLESMAGKSSSCHGIIHEATPFIFSEDKKGSDYYGKLLTSAGFNYYGTEMMFSGVDGRPLKADIFIGVIFYIRLRHMVGDKYQVRSTGPIDSVTHQPVKGRKRCGGIRFGEMERDSLLAHGASYLVQDRLFTQSDECKCYGCSKCGSIVSTNLLAREDYNEDSFGERQKTWYCTICKSSEHIKSIQIPYVLRYLTAELASANIKLEFEF